MARAENDTTDSESLLRLGEGLRGLRLAVGISQAELAQRLGTGKPSLSRLERGKVNAGWVMVDRYIEACGYQPRLEAILTSARPGAQEGAAKTIVEVDNNDDS